MDYKEIEKINTLNPFERVEFLRVPHLVVINKGTIPVLGFTFTECYIIASKNDYDFLKMFGFRKCKDTDTRATHCNLERTDEMHYALCELQCNDRELRLFNKKYLELYNIVKKHRDGTILERDGFKFIEYTQTLKNKKMRLPLSKRIV